MPSAALSQTTMAQSCDSAAASASAPGFTTAKTSGMTECRWRAACAAMVTPCGRRCESLSDPNRVADPAASRIPTSLKSWF
jgi:hypothetical protein